MSVPAIVSGLAGGEREVDAERRRRREACRVRGSVRVAVVGGGVAGLSAACDLRALGAKVVIIEDRDVRETPSWVAAGLIEPVAGTQDRAGMQRELAAFERSMQVWRAVAASGSPLISRRRVLTVCATSRPPLPWADAVEGFRPVARGEVPARYVDGDAASFSTYVVETSRWLMATRARLARDGVRFVRARVETLDQVTERVGPVDGIVNASGLGAARLAQDPTLFRGDGHIVRVRPTAGVHDVFMDETRAPEDVAADPYAVNMLYIIPRRHDIVIGGTLWDSPNVDGVPQRLPGMGEHLRALAAEVEPRLARAPILEYLVGARPRRRAGVRVELQADGAVPVAHLYGQGGSGWTLAPGLAEQAVGLLADATWARRVA
ncbi:MAG: FAD-dependent oxidoreductase [Baekduia sp.]